MTVISAPDAPLLQVGTLTKTFGGFTALDNISVDIRKGERFGLIGPNSSGKTTLINCISGALRPQTGSVVFCGEDITQLPPHLHARRGIARSFQIPRPFKSMTVLENLMVGLDFATVGSSLPEEDVAMSILTRMGLAVQGRRVDRYAEPGGIAQDGARARDGGAAETFDFGRGDGGAFLIPRSTRCWIC